MTYVNLGIAAVGVVSDIFGGRSARNAAKKQAALESGRAAKEADLREQDLFAEYEATQEQQRDALAKRDLALRAEAEMLRQAQLAGQELNIDLSGQALTGQERAARRRAYFEDT